MEKQNNINCDEFKLYVRQFKNAIDTLLVDNNKRYNYLQNRFAELNKIDVASPLVLMFVTFCLGTDSEDILLHKAIKEHRTNPDIKTADQLYKWCTDELNGKHDKHQIVYLNIPPFC